MCADVCVCACSLVHACLIDMCCADGKDASDESRNDGDMEAGLPPRGSVCSAASERSRRSVLDEKEEHLYQEDYLHSTLAKCDCARDIAMTTERLFVCVSACACVYLWLHGG